MNRRITRTALRVGAVLALVPTLGAAPAVTAAPAPLEPSGYCITPDGGGAARGAAAGRGHDTRGISAAQQRAIERRTRKVLAHRKRHRAATNPITDIPVYVHVMTSKSGAGDVSAAQITQQIAVLNQTYSGQDVDRPGRLDTGVRFTLAGIDRYRNDVWHTDGQSTTYRSRTRQGGRNALNIWLVDFDYLGVATFPWDYARNPSIDGIRVLVTSLPGGSATHYDQGETVTHETGHWLGLYHTFQGGCTLQGDSVADTPSQASPSSGCPTSRDSCSLPGKDPVHDYMDYSYDSCYYEFTAGQSARIARMWSAYRA